MQRLTVVQLTARITFDDGVYLAKVDQLSVEATGTSSERAQDELAEVVRSWIQVQDSSDALETSLSAAGFAGSATITRLFGASRFVTMTN